MKIRIIRHEVVPESGSFEVRFPDGRPSRYFYWDNIPSRWLRPDLTDSEAAKTEALQLARAELNKLDSQSRR